MGLSNSMSAASAMHYTIAEDIAQAATASSTKCHNTAGTSMPKHLPVEHAHDLAALIVHNGLLLLVPQYWHGVLPCRGMPCIGNQLHLNGVSIECVHTVRSTHTNNIVKSVKAETRHKQSCLHPFSAHMDAHSLEHTYLPGQNGMGTTAVLHTVTRTNRMSKHDNAMTGFACRFWQKTEHNGRELATWTGSSQQIQIRTFAAAILRPIHTGKREGCWSPGYHNAIIVIVLY